MSSTLRLDKALIFFYRNFLRMLLFPIALGKSNFCGKVILCINKLMFWISSLQPRCSIGERGC